MVKVLSKLSIISIQSLQSFDADVSFLPVTTNISFRAYIFLAFNVVVMQNSHLIFNFLIFSFKSAYNFVRGYAARRTNNAQIKNVIIFMCKKHE